MDDFGTSIGNAVVSVVNNAANSLLDELSQLQRNPLGSSQAYDSSVGSISNYTTKLFGAPFQLLDSVDKRFNDAPDVGAEYLRNFLLNSPILYIQPGVPHYTGGESGESLINNMYKDSASGLMSNLSSALLSGLQKSVFDGDNLQKRMFEIKETYYDYMKCVNYMCRSVAIYMGLTEENENFPNFAFISGNKDQDFETMRWENYRMMKNDYVPTPREKLGLYLKVSVLGDALMNIFTLGNSTAIDDYPWGESSNNEVMDVWSKMFSDSKYTAFDIYNLIPKTVQFMVEPVAFEESISNTTAPSMIESFIDSISSGIGSEIGFIMNANVDTGITDELAGILGSGISSASQAMSDLIAPATGGFLGSLFQGAVNSVKGQKMIYPDIYKSSTSTMDYQFTITLTSPYGDMYNYYMNIVVPLLHLIALVAPRMISSNSTASPFLVKAYMPGMCTCDMGIISNMSISKNPSGKHVSINGYPLTVKVTFTIKELYNALAVSPGDNPTSFLFNETLNDYLCNLAGLVPSLETHARVRANMLGQVGNYFSEWDDTNLAEGIVENIENLIFF